MQIRDFLLENYFGQYEFSAPYLLAQSDCESMTASELLQGEEGAAEGYLNQWLGYTETWGNPELRKLVGQLFTTMSDTDVLMLHGAEEGIFALMNVLLSPGDHLITMFPNYQSAYEVANSIPGCSYSPWKQRDLGDHWGMDFDELESLVRPETKVIAINSPCNPTGYTFTVDEMKRLVDICRRHGLYLFADEVYHGLELCGEPRPFMADLYEKAITLGVMSKSYGLPGLRVGWLVTKDTVLLEKVWKFKQYLSICDSAPSEYLCAVALRRGASIIERNRLLIRENMAAADAFFAKYPQLFEKKNQTAGPVAFHRLCLPMNIQDFCRLAVEKKGVLLLPGTVYEWEGNYFRMGYGRRSMKSALIKLEEFLDDTVLPSNGVS